MTFPASGAKLSNCYINTTLTRELNCVFWNKAHTDWVLLPAQTRFTIMCNLCTRRGSLVIQETEGAKRLFQVWQEILVSTSGQMALKLGRKHVVHCQLFQGPPHIATYFYHSIVSSRVVYILLKASTVESIWLYVETFIILVTVEKTLEK